MAAKIVGNFSIEKNSFPFTGIAFGRIGGQNVGVKLTQEVEKNIVELGFFVVCQSECQDHSLIQ